MTGAISWIVTWVAMIALLALLASTSWGKTIVYYFLWLAVALLIVSHASELTSAINVNALQLNG
jgi:hypothetical protein